MLAQTTPKKRQVTIVGKKKKVEKQEPGEQTQKRKISKQKRGDYNRERRLEFARGKGGNLNVPKKKRTWLNLLPPQKERRTHKNARESKEYRNFDTSPLKRIAILGKQQERNGWRMRPTVAGKKKKRISHPEKRVAMKRRSHQKTLCLTKEGKGSGHERIMRKNRSAEPRSPKAARTRAGVRKNYR